MDAERIPRRPDYGSGMAGGSLTEQREQDAWDAKWAPDLRTARLTIERIIDERSEVCAEILRLKKSVEEVIGWRDQALLEITANEAKIAELRQSVSLLDSEGRKMKHERDADRAAFESAIAQRDGDVAHEKERADRLLKHIQHAFKNIQEETLRTYLAAVLRAEGRPMDASVEKVAEIDCHDCRGNGFMKTGSGPDIMVKKCNAGEACPVPREQAARRFAALELSARPSGRFA